MEAIASPRKPSVAMWPKSSWVRTLLVAWRRNITGTSSGAMPLPLSLTRIIVTPPWRISMVTLLAPASIEFSTSSLTTEDGRSTTSPAAISWETSSSNSLIMPIVFTSFLSCCVDWFYCLSSASGAGPRLISRQSVRPIR